MCIPNRWLGALLALLSLAPAARAGEAPPAARSADDTMVIPVGCADGVTAAQLSLTGTLDGLAATRRRAATR